MSRRIICDICNREADLTKPSVQPWCGFVYSTIEVLSGQLKQESYDLCFKCSETVRDFIRKQKNAGTERQGINNSFDQKSLEDTKGTCIKIRP